MYAEELIQNRRYLVKNNFTPEKEEGRKTKIVAGTQLLFINESVDGFVFEIYQDSPQDQTEEIVLSYCEVCKNIEEA